MPNFTYRIVMNTIAISGNTVLCAIFSVNFYSVPKNLIKIEETIVVNDHSAQKVFIR